MVPRRADSLRLSSERMAALVKGPAGFIHQLLTRLTRRVAAEFDPGEAAAYKEAAREAFRTTGAVLGAPVASRPASQADIAGPMVSAEDQLDLVDRPPPYERKLGPGRSPVVGASPGRKAVNPAEITSEDAVLDPTAPGQARNQAKTSAPDHLLRKPANVTRVADDFFDGIVRRVEGDR